MTARQRRPCTAAEAREAAVEARLIAEPLLPDHEPDPSREATHPGCHELLRISAHLESVITLLNLLRISVAAGHSFRFLLDSGNGGRWTPSSTLVDTHNVLPVGVDAAAPSCHVGLPGRCAAG